MTDFPNPKSKQTLKDHEIRSVWFFPYELHPIGDLSRIQSTHPRQGALLRVEDQGGCSGFSDCHPLQEFGDAPISEQLNLLKEGWSNGLLEASFYFAQLDREARRDGISLFADLEIPMSHKLIVSGAQRRKILNKIEESVDAQFRVFKFKMGFDLSFESELLNVLTENFSDRFLESDLSLRVDFNETLSGERFIEFAEKLNSQSCLQIDFVEDPTPFEASLWKELSISSKLQFAVDRAFSSVTSWEPLNEFVVIYKPARSSYGRWEDSCVGSRSRVVVTSSMDHPLGQMAAAYVGARIKQQGRQNEVCGLLTHEMFEKSEFSEQVHTSGPSLLPASGTGFGFDDTLEKLPWKRLI